MDGAAECKRTFAAAAFQLDRLHLARNWDDRPFQHILPNIVVHLYLVRLHFAQHRLARQLFQQKHSALGGQTQLRSHQRRVRLCLLASSKFLFGHLLHLFCCALGALGIPLLGCLPVHQRSRNLLPFGPLRTEIFHPLAVNFPLCRGLVAAVGQNQPLHRLSGRARRQQQQNRRQTLHRKQHSPLHKLTRYYYCLLGCPSPHPLGKCFHISLSSPACPRRGFRGKLIVHPCEIHQLKYILITRSKCRQSTSL